MDTPHLLTYRITLRDAVTGQQFYSCLCRAYDEQDAIRRARARAALAGVRQAAAADAHVEAQHTPAERATVDTIERMLSARLDTFPLIQGPAS